MAKQIDPAALASVLENARVRLDDALGQLVEGKRPGVVRDPEALQDSINTSCTNTACLGLEDVAEQVTRRT